MLAAAIAPDALPQKTAKKKNNRRIEWLKTRGRHRAFFHAIENAMSRRVYIAIINKNNANIKKYGIKTIAFRLLL